MSASLVLTIAKCMNKKKDKIKNIFYEIFKTQKIKNFEELKMGQIPEWDSLGNLNLLLKIEEAFKVKFSIEEMTKINSIKKIRKFFNKKINK